MTKISHNKIHNDNNLIFESAHKMRWSIQIVNADKGKELPGNTVLPSLLTEVWPPCPSIFIIFVSAILNGHADKLLSPYFPGLARSQGHLYPATSSLAPTILAFQSHGFPQRTPSSHTSLNKYAVSSKLQFCHKCTLAKWSPSHSSNQQQYVSCLHLQTAHQLAGNVTPTQNNCKISKFSLLWLDLNFLDSGV